jgi:hypothetical protein
MPIGPSGRTVRLLARKAIFRERREIVSRLKRPLLCPLNYTPKILYIYTTSRIILQEN